MPGDIMPMNWYSWGCYYGAAYLLETMLTGFQASSLLDPLSSVDGDMCIARCAEAPEPYSYAMVVGGLCFCNDKAPSKDSQAISQFTYVHHSIRSRMLIELLSGATFHAQTTRFSGAVELPRAPVQGGTRQGVVTWSTFIVLRRRLPMSRQR
jgi:hypothetical protein